MKLTVSSKANCPLLLVITKKKIKQSISHSMTLKNNYSHSWVCRLTVVDWSRLGSAEQFCFKLQIQLDLVFVKDELGSAYVYPFLDPCWRYSSSYSNGKSTRDTCPFHVSTYLTIVKILLTKASHIIEFKVK